MDHSKSKELEATDPALPDFLCGQKLSGVCRDLQRVRLNRFEDLAALRVGYQKLSYNVKICRILFWTS